MNIHNMGYCTWIFIFASVEKVLALFLQLIYAFDSAT